MIESRLQELPVAEREQWDVSLTIRTGDDTALVRDFEPPVILVPDGHVLEDPTAPEGPSLAVVRVINNGSAIREAFEDEAVNANAVFSHGATAPAGRQFFGARETLSGSGEIHGTDGDPLVPRAPAITIMATYKNLLDVLKYELLIEESPTYPPDGFRAGSGLAAPLLESVIPLPDEVRRQLLLEMIAAHEAGEPLPPMPAGVELDGKAWDAITRYAFLEYDYFYAYNDWERYQVAIWDNQHEGDDEGCCLVFDRNIINLAAATGDDDQLRRAIPHSIITCVHDELQDADLFEFIPTPVPPAEDPNWLPRDDLDLIVYAAGGSHATYLDNGQNGRHDVVDLGDMWATVEDIGTVLAAFALSPAIIIFALWEKLQDTEDFTSDGGIHTGPAEFIGNNPSDMKSTLVVMPTSTEDNIYQDQHADLLRLRAFAGKWGGHDGIINNSPIFSVKTGRYFRKLLKGSLGGDVI
jgi:hypothetical protein